MYLCTPKRGGECILSLFIRLVCSFYLYNLCIICSSFHTRASVMLGFDEIFEILYKVVFIMLFRTLSKKALFIAAMFLAAPAVAGTVGGVKSR